MIPEIVDTIILMALGVFLLLALALFLVPFFRPLAPFLLFAWIGAAIMAVLYRFVFPIGMDRLVQSGLVDPNHWSGYLLLHPIGLILGSGLTVIFGSLLGILCYFRFIHH